MNELELKKNGNSLRKQSVLLETVTWLDRKLWRGT